MRSAELTFGRAIGIALEPGDDVLAGIGAACAHHGIGQGVIVTFSGAFRDVELIAGEGAPDDPEVPEPRRVHVPYTEGVGSGTVVTVDALSVHLHVAIGRKDASGQGYAGHVIQASAHYVVEIVVQEVTSPVMTRESSPAAFGLPTLGFADEPLP